MPRHSLVVLISAVVLIACGQRSAPEQTQLAARVPRACEKRVEALEAYLGGGPTRCETDLLGLPARIDVIAPSGATLYGVTIGRNPWGGITALEDDDERGLDHSASFGYDDRARLTSATLGAATPYVLGFAYGGARGRGARRPARRTRTRRRWPPPVPAPGRWPRCARR